MSGPANNTLPANVDAERSILGAILLNNAAYTETAEHLKPEDFLLDSHRRIYRRMAKLAESSRSIDLITLTEELSRHGECESIGGAAYITGLLDGTPDRPSIANYVRIVRDKALARGIIHTATAAIARASDQSNDVHEILSGLTEHVANLAQRGSGGETLGHTYEEILSVPAVEFVIDGFLQAAGVTLIGGLSGHGKTLIMLAMVRALLEGEKLFHRFTVTAPATKVIYLIPECGLGPFAHRLKTFRLTEYVRENRLICRTLSKKPISLNSPLLVREVPGADVFLDTAVRFKDGDENDAAENNEFAESLFNLQRAGARTITGAHHAPKGFARDTVMTLENILRGTGDIGAMLCTCWGIRQIDAAQNRIFVQNVKPRDFLPCDPFIIQGRPSIDQGGYFDLTEPPGFAGELADHVSREKNGRPAVSTETEEQARQMHSAGKSYDEIAKALNVSKGWLSKKLRSRS